MNKNVTLKKIPLIGQVQHGQKIIGDNGKPKIVDYGYFIAKIRDNNMTPYLDKFNKLIKGSKSIDIQFLEENPLSIRKERCNQGGRACYCMEGQLMGKQKIKNLWQDIECKEDCTYLKKDSYGKSQCNRIAWLKFFIPSIATDRIWLMRITGQETIDNLKNYIAVQEMQKNSLKNCIYTIFLTQKEQVSASGQVHNNYVLDILKKEDFNSNKEISQTNTDNIKIDTSQNDSKITENNSKSNVVNSEPKQVSMGNSDKESNKSKSKSIKENDSKSEYDDCYILLESYTKIIENKEYFMTKFTDMKDQISEIAIKPDFVDELLKCELGTVVRLDIKEVKGMKFAIGIEFAEKHLKKSVA